MNKPQAIIFDADGVIFDSEKLWDIGDSNFLARRGLSAFPERLKPELAGTSVAAGTALLLECAGSEENLDDAVRERIATMEGLYAEQIEFMPGFMEFLSYVKSRSLKTAVATSMSRSLFPAIDNRLNFLELFEGKVFSVVDVLKPKPAPDVYLHAAKNIAAAPENCLVIEDSPNGILAAKAAGMFCIGLSTTFAPENISMADAVFKSFKEIEHFIETL